MKETESAKRDSQRPANHDDSEFLPALLDIEKRAFLPLKWLIFGVAAGFWALGRPLHWPPPPDVFALFVTYLFTTLAETYLVWLSRVATHQIRPLCIASYVLDVVFVSLLVWFDSVRYAVPAAGPTDFYLLYFIVLLRSFALFRTARATILVNTLIGILFLVNLFWQDTSDPRTWLRTSVIRLVFFWIVVFMTAYIAALINKQKAELMEAREKLLRSENMALLGQLAAGVAHEVNNPIGVISAYAEYLAKNCPPDDPRREDFQAIHRESLRCKSIVEGLLNFARKAPPERMPLDVRELVEQVLSFVTRPDDSNLVKIERQYAADLPQVEGDSTQLSQALLNIVLNAKQALGEGGGTIRVSLGGLTNPERVRIEVADTGCGIPPEDLPQVFVPFFSRRRGGTGLGLAISKRIIEEHGGEIRLTSDPGAGTLVEILLPAIRKKGSSAKLRRIGG